MTPKHLEDPRPAPPRPGAPPLAPAPPSVALSAPVVSQAQQAGDAGTHGMATAAAAAPSVAPSATFVTAQAMPLRDVRDDKGEAGNDRGDQAMSSAASVQPDAVIAPRVNGQPLAAPRPASSAPPHVTIAATPGQMGKDMGVSIARHIADGREQLLVRLDPPDMGRIDVRLSFDSDGGLRAVMAADSPSALHLLRREAGDLVRALGEAGVRADAQSFTFDSRGSEAGQFWQRGGQQQSQGGGRHAAASHAPTDGQAMPAEQSPYRGLRASGRVDLMA